MVNVLIGLWLILKSLLLELRCFPREMHIALVLGILLGFWAPFRYKTEINLRGSAVVITGGSKGIGEELAYAYARAGARLMLTSRSEKLLQQVILKCKHLGAAEASYVVADMSKIEESALVIQEAAEKFGGKLDVVVLNHAIQFPGGEWLGTAQNFSAMRAAMEVNYFSYVSVVSAAIAQMKQTGTAGRIVAISSFWGRYAFPYFGPYVSSKFALEGFFHSLQHELAMASSNISITVAALGRINTATQRSVMNSFGLKRLGLLPIGKRPQDVAAAILDASYHRRPELVFPAYFRLVLLAARIPVLSDLLNWTTRFMLQRY